MLRQTIRTLGIAAAILTTPTAALADTSKLAACIASNAPQDSFKAKLHLRTTDPQSDVQELDSRVLGLKLGERMNLNLRIQAPSNLSGTAFLMQEQDGQDSMHVYLPGLRKTRRVTGSMGQQELWGTSFSYNDIKQLFGAFAQGELSAEGTAELDGHAVAALKLVPAPELEVDYAYLRVWIHADSCVPAGIDIVTSEERVAKTLRSEHGSIARLGDYQLATVWHMQDLTTQRATTATLSEVEYDESISRAAFQTRGFEAAP